MNTVLYNVSIQDPATAHRADVPLAAAPGRANTGHAPAAHRAPPPRRAHSAAASAAPRARPPTLRAAALRTAAAARNPVAVAPGPDHARAPLLETGTILLVPSSGKFSTNKTFPTKINLVVFR